MTVFVDTNYFLRYLLQDIEDQYEIAKKLFKEGSLKKVELFTSTLVIFELYWVLIKFYKRPVKEVLNTLKEICEFEFLDIENRNIVKDAIHMAQKSNLGLQDSFNLIYAQNNNAIDFKTFDIKLSKAFKNL